MPNRFDYRRTRFKQRPIGEDTILAQIFDSNSAIDEVPSGQADGYARQNGLQLGIRRSDDDLI